MSIYNYSKALLIGINYQNTYNELFGCLNDVEHLKTHIEKTYLFKEVKILTEKEATFDNIKKYVNWLTDGCKQGDVLFMSYSGHGSNQVDKSSDEADKRDETIVPIDFSKKGEIVDDWLRQNLVDKVPFGAKLVAIFDSCHSGTILDLRYTVVGANYNQVKYDSKYPETKGKIICIGGCKDNQTSADTVENRVSQGALTFGFLEACKQIAEDKTTWSCQNCKGSCFTLYKKLSEILKQKRYTQQPQMQFGKSPTLHEVFL